MNEILIFNLKFWIYNHKMLGVQEISWHPYDNTARDLNHIYWKKLPLFLSGFIVVKCCFASEYEQHESWQYHGLFETDIIVGCFKNVIYI